MRTHRNLLPALGTALLLVLTGCASDPAPSAPDAHVAEPSDAPETAQEPSSESDGYTTDSDTTDADGTDAAEVTVPDGAYAASADFPFPIPDGWAVLEDFTEGTLGKDVTMDGSVEYPGDAKDAAATYLALLKDAGFDASTYAPGELTNQASLAAEGVINGTLYLAILNFDVHADGSQRVSITAAERD